MSHWDEQARQWQYIAEPLRPSQLDVLNFTHWIHESYETIKRPLTVLLLGVTPEIVNIQWPNDCRLFTVDRNMAMIKSLLPPVIPFIKPQAILANWLQLPFRKASFDLIIGDGCYNSLTLAEYPILSQLIKYLLRDKGSFICRFFSRTPCNESVETIQQDILTHKIGNFSTFKLRLLMMLHESLNKGVCLEDAWNCWNQQFKSLVDKAKNKLGWTEEMINVINNYRDQSACYTFPTLIEIKNHFAEYLQVLEIYMPSYPLGRQCPTFKFIK